MGANLGEKRRTSRKGRRSRRPQDAGPLRPFPDICPRVRDIGRTVPGVRTAVKRPARGGHEWPDLAKIGMRPAVRRPSRPPEAGTPLARSHRTLGG